METQIGYIERSELTLEGRDNEVCMECRLKGLNLCDIDEICQMRLASALGEKKYPIIEKSIDHAKDKGLVEVREVAVKGKRPKRFIKITDQGKTFFGFMK